jgi:hypothetical protein
MKKLIVVALEKLCTFIDTRIVEYLPERIQVHWYCKLAELSARLDEKWKTGVWK